LSRFASNIRKQRQNLYFLIPAGVFIAAVFIVPIWNVLYRSFDENGFTTKHYVELLSSTLFYRVLWNTIQISILASVFTVIIAYPMAYHLSRLKPSSRAMFMIFVMLPFWTSILVKSYAFMVILGQNGLINSLLGEVGLSPVALIYNRIGVIVGMVHFLVPFVLFPILTNLLSQDGNIVRAAETMGATSGRIFLKITLPLSLPGILAGMLLAAVQSFGFFITAALLGGRKDLMIANLVDFYTKETLDWGAASAVSVVLTVMCATILIVLGRFLGGMSGIGKAM
jgi:ABC-type spermidine/putrescine transport system permease subunit I